MSVNHSIKGESISPARGEVQNVDLTVRSRGLPNPAQQYLLTVGLLQIWHDVLHYILHLQGSNKYTLQTYAPLFLFTKPNYFTSHERVFPTKSYESNSNSPHEIWEQQSSGHLCTLLITRTSDASCNNDTLLLHYDPPTLLGAVCAKHRKQYSSLPCAVLPPVNKL